MTTTALSEVLAEMDRMPQIPMAAAWKRRIESALASAEPVLGWANPRDVEKVRRPRSKRDGSALAVFIHGEQSEDYSIPIYTHAQPAVKVEAPGYKLSDEQIATLLSEGLKPEEIGGTAEVQHARVGELVRWFARLATGSANPKWARAHAFELAYFVATNAGNRYIDINKVREAGFKEGAMMSPQDRGMLERIGFLQPMPAPTPATDYPECSGDPASCPENEGHGCCKPNPVKSPASVPDGLLAALERAAAAESALRRLVDECENDHVRGWEDRMKQCIAEANALLASEAPPTNQEGAAP